MRRSTVRRPAAWFVAGAFIGLLLVAAVIGTVTRSVWGREQVLAFTLRTLGGRLNGALEIDRVDGNLITGARLYELSLRGADGFPLLVADSAYINYEVPTFLGGDIVIHSLVLYRADLRLRRLPGDSLWNYQQILSDTTPGPDTGPGRATLIETLQLVDGDVTVLQPWTPDEAFERLAAGPREEALAAALSDTARLVVEEVPGGYLRTILLDVASAELREVVVAPDERGGTYLEIAGFAGDVRLWRDPPMRVQAAEGRVSLREGIVRFDAPVIGLPGSTVASEGAIDLNDGGPAYDVVLLSDAAQLSDLQWLYPALPERGVASFRMTVETRPDGLLILAREFVVETPDTRVAGSFGVVAGDTLRFVDVDLEADPLSVPTVERLLPAGIPVEGLRIGSVAIQGTRS